MEYQVITPEGVEYLKSVTAPDRVFYGDEIEYDYAQDEMPDFGTHAPDVLVEVLSTEEVSKVMRYAYEHCIPVTPRGAGTGLSGGAVPIYGGILLCTEKMNKILEWDLDTMTVGYGTGKCRTGKRCVLSAGAGGKDSFRWWKCYDKCRWYESRRLWRYEKLCGFHGMCDAKR